MFTCTLQDLGATLGLKKYGKEYVGPCPYCGGRDRFFIGPGKKHDLAFGCRGCGKDTAGIFKELENLGLWTPEEIDRPIFSQRDHAHGLLLSMIAESAAAKGQRGTAKDRQDIYKHAAKVEPDLRERLMQALVKLKGN